MTEPTSAQELFKGRHFDREIIVLCVRWYLTFKLSSRDLVQMMAERGITLTHTTIFRWVQRYGPEFGPHGKGGIGSEEFVAKDLGEEDIVGLVFGFELVATDGAVG